MPLEIADMVLPLEVITMTCSCYYAMQELRFVLESYVILHKFFLAIVGCF